MKEDNKNNETIEEIKKGSYLTGVIGAILGGLIAAIPWILTYCFGNMIVAILSVLIAFGAFQGYKLFKGRIGRPLPFIIAVVSVLVIIISTVVICPIILMSKENIDITFENFKLVYSASEFKEAILQDLMVSLIFTIVGIAAIIKSIYMQIKNGEKDIKFNEDVLTEEEHKQAQEKAQAVKSACETLSAFDKESSVKKEEIINELELTQELSVKKAKQYFNYIFSVGVLKKYKGKYYYDSSNEDEKLKRVVQTSYNNKTTLIIVGVFIVCLVIFAIIAANINHSDTKNNNINENKYEYVLPDTSVKLNITSEMYLYKDEKEITQYFGEDYSEYYDFIVLTAEGEVGIYGIITSKDEYKEDYTIDDVAEYDRKYTSQYFENVTEIQEENINGIKFKKYGYEDNNNNFTSYIYLAEINDKYLFLDTYSDIGNESEIWSTVRKLFK